MALRSHENTTATQHHAVVIGRDTDDTKLPCFRHNRGAYYVGRNNAALENAVMANDAVWTQIDPASLNPELRDLYADYVAKRRAAGAAKSEFEKAMNEGAELSSGKRMVFGYNFGKLSAAIVEDDKPASKPKAQAQSLASFLSAQASNGRAL